MSQFEVRARLKVREGKLEEFKRHAAEMIRQTREKDTGTLAYDWFLSKDGTECEVRETYVDPDALVEHAFHVREAREALFAGSAYDHKMAFYGDPRLRSSIWWTRSGWTSRGSPSSRRLSLRASTEWGRRASEAMVSSAADIGRRRG